MLVPIPSIHRARSNTYVCRKEVIAVFSSSGWHKARKNTGSWGRYAERLVDDSSLESTKGQELGITGWHLWGSTNQIGQIGQVLIFHQSILVRLYRAEFVQQLLLDRGILQEAPYSVSYCRHSGLSTANNKGECLVHQPLG